MEKNIDDFFKRKIENIQETLPESVAFDETLLWRNIQQDLRKPKRFVWYWVMPVAACLVALVSWWILPEHKGLLHTPTAVVHLKTIITPVITEKRIKNVNLEKHPKIPSFKKNKTTISQKLDFRVERIALKNVDFSNKNSNKLPDSLAFQSNIAFEKKPKMNFKTVHINEISKQEDAPFKQTRFKIQFATIGTIQTKTYNNEIIKTPSIRTQ